MSNKKLLSFILCFCVLLSCLFFFDKAPTAIGGASGGYESAEPVIPPESDFTYEYCSDVPEDGVIITAYSGKETKIIVPETLGGAPVIEIYPEVFSKNEKITSIKLPSTLQFLDGSAFVLCSSLTEILVDEDNPDLVSVDGVLYYKNYDKNSPLYGKPEYLSNFPAGKGGSFTVPYGVTTIGGYAFSHCYNLTEVNMYNTVTRIDSYAFSHCWNLKKIRLSDNLKILRKEALAYCDSLKRIDLPATLKEIGTDAVLGGIDSDDNKFYYFVDGISCTKDSYAHKYLLKQALSQDIIILNKPSITDNNTGIKLIDAYDTLPENEMLDISVKAVELAEVEQLLPTRYSEAYAFDIDVMKNNEAFAFDGNIVFNFDTVCPNAIPSATKVYQQIGDELVLVSGSVHSPFVGAQVSQGGRFVVLVNNDFSLKGDIDGDGVVTLFDVKAALHASTGTLTLTYEQRLAANVHNSESNKITTDDARKILRLAGGMSIE
ncbi:MAG: leucine-rich repeat protein [Acutalibacteraceae bacterium]|nr:leucine-rich repeat protein [Acutalibacteraceae bacterium]